MTGASQPNPIVSAGKIHLLDLGALKERLGQKWERMAQHVQMFFEAAIRRALTPGDTFCRFEELTYLIMFRELSAAEAELKCAAISDEVCRRLFGENGEQVSLRNLIAHVGLAATPIGAEQNAALDAQLERDGKETIVTRQPETRQRQRSPATNAFRLVVGGNPISRQSISLQDLAFTYRPIWDVTNDAVLTYLCQPEAPLLVSGAAMGFCCTDKEDDQPILDLHVLRECLERASRLRAGGLRVVLAVPVHFATIGRSRSWRDYSDALRRVTAETRRDLAFIVFGIDRGVPNIRLAQELPKLSRMACRVFCIADRCQGVGARFVSTGAHGVGITLDEKDDELQSASRIREIAKEAQAAAIDSFVLGLQSTSLALSSIHSDIRYLEGPVVRPAVSDPRHGFAHSVEDIYKAKRMIS
jgi:hypothetical protein